MKSSKYFLVGIFIAALVTGGCSSITSSQSETHHTETSHVESSQQQNPQTRHIELVNEDLVLENRLAIPPLLEAREENGEKVFALKIQEGQTELLKGKPAKTWGFNGSYLGPTIRVNTGDKVRFNITNTLGETTTVHWHGMHVPPSMDGGPHQTIQAGETWQPYWTIQNEAATLWYHPHQMGKTGEHVYKGLAGLFIINDENSASVDIPKNYGVDDLPLVIQDRKFDANGQLIYDHDHKNHAAVTPGMLGETILVNGTHAPYVDVPAKLIRLRLVNGSNARRYNFGFSDNRTFQQIATDGGLLETPVERNHILLSPGERAEILVDLSNATDPITLMSYPVIDPVNKIQSEIFSSIVGKDDQYQQFKILEIRPKLEGATSTDFAQTVPQKLNAISRPKETDAVKTRSFRLDAVTINNKTMDHNRIDEIVKKGDVEIWKIYNDSPIYHPFHIHGIQFLVLDRNGKTPAAYEQGWKDTIMVNHAETVRILVQFKNYTDPTQPYMYHCHILEHEDMGMMGQFVVVDNVTDKVEIKNPEAPTIETPGNQKPGDQKSESHQHH